MLNKRLNTKNQVGEFLFKEEHQKNDICCALGGRLADLPPPPPSHNPDYIQCPHCGRNYAPNVAERHIPKCVNIQAKPKPPPSMARTGAQQRMGPPPSSNTMSTRAAPTNTRSSSGGYGNSAAYPPPNRSTRGGRY